MKQEKTVEEILKNPTKQEITTRDNLTFNTMIFEDAKIVYIAIPKAACTSIKWWLNENINYKSKNEKKISSETSFDRMIHDRIKGTETQASSAGIENLLYQLCRTDAYRFSVVRNPFTRIFSAWWSKIVANEESQHYSIKDSAIWDNYPANREEIKSGFERFLLYLEEKENKAGNPHWESQYKLLLPNKIKYDNIYKLEKINKLENDLRESISFSKSYTPLSLKNKSDIKYNIEYLTNKSINIIQKIYEMDFNNFGYNKTPPSGEKINTFIEKCTLNSLPEIREKNKIISMLYKKIDSKSID